MPARLNDNLGFLLVRCARSIKRLLDSKLAPHHVTATQFQVLACLWEEDGISLTQLGQQTYLDNPTLTGLVDRMEREQLVARIDHPDDRRVTRIFLTPKARALEAVLPALADEALATARAGLACEQVDALASSLAVLWHNTDGKSKRSKTDLPVTG